MESVVLCRGLESARMCGEETPTAGALLLAFVRSEGGCHGYYA